MPAHEDPRRPSEGTGLRAALFDLDGVLAPTSVLHRQAWREVLSSVFAEHGAGPAYSEGDYFELIDGRPRFDGVSAALASRGIQLEWGSADDQPGGMTVCAIGNRKNEVFERLLAAGDLPTFPETIRVLNRLRSAGVPMAVVSSSRNAGAVLSALGILDFFAIVVDGSLAAAEKLPGKPDPATFRFAAEALGVPAAATMVVEDAVFGVAAARAGGFRLVVGVDRGAGRDVLLAAGADVVVDDLAGLPLFWNQQREPDVPNDPAFHDPQEDLDGWVLKVAPDSPEPTGTGFSAVASTVTALSNGYLGVRGPGDQPRSLGTGTFVNGLHETFPIQHAEHAYGLAFCGQVIQGVPDASTFAIRCDGRLLAHDSARLSATEQELDLRNGVGRLHQIWHLRESGRVKVVQQRMVCLHDPYLALFSCEVTPLDRRCEVEIARVLIDHAPERGSEGSDRDPRRSEHTHDGGLVLETIEADDEIELRGYRCRTSREPVALGLTSLVGCSDGSTRVAGGGRATVSLEPGQSARMTTMAVYHTVDAPPVGVGDPNLVTRAGLAQSDHLVADCRTSLSAAVATGVAELYARQRRWLDGFWERSDVRVDAGPESAATQQAIRWSIFQVGQASAQLRGHGVPAKGLTGSGYSGHYFWDTEIYLLPFLTYTNPAAARNLLEFRHAMLPAARRRAVQLDVDGALFPWRTINGEEASAYYPAGTAQFHIDADIAFAARQYAAVAGDQEFAGHQGLDLLVETARMWVSLGFWQADGDQQFHIHGVTGPDEYTAVVDDNYFTNVMAKFNLAQAAAVLGELAAADPDAHAAALLRLGVLPEEPAAWERAARDMYLPWDEPRGIHPQDAHFLSRKRWDLAATPRERRPLLLHYHSLVIYRHQVLKQADVILAHLLRGSDLTLEQKRADFDYYEPLTSGDSTLSAFAQAVLAAEVGHSELALRHFYDALRIDLDDRHHNTGEGVHLAAAGGVWMLLVNGFGGLRDYGQDIRLDPKLPDPWRSLEFRLVVRGTRLQIRVSHDAVTIDASGGDSLVLSVFGQPVQVDPGQRQCISYPERLQRSPGIHPLA